MSVRDSSYMESYERFLWNILCRRQSLQGHFSANKAKRLAVMAYCLYYRGVTVSQIMLSKMSDATDASVIRATMAKYATSDIRCSVVPKSHVADDVEGLAEVTDIDRKKPYFVYQLLYGRKKYNVYELSSYGLNKSIYDLLDLPAEFLSGVTRSDLEQLAKQYRKRKSLQFSDEAAHLLAVRDFGAYCYGSLNFRPFVYHTECRFFENGEFIRTGSFGSRNAAVASTAQISDGYMEYMPISRVTTDMQSVYVEQDMGTQSRSYLRKNKLLHYLDFVRYSFRKHPALVTLLFSLQTRASFHYPKEERMPAGAALSYRYAPSLRQEIMIRAYECYGDRWEDTLLSEFRRRTAATLKNCPNVRTHLQNELDLFDSVLAIHTYATISELLTYIGNDSRRKKPVSDEFQASDRFYYKQRRLEIYEESMHIPEFRDVLLEGFSVMFVPNQALSARIPCLMPEMCGISSDHNMPQSQAAVRLSKIIQGILGIPVFDLDYKPYVRSDRHLFRNHYFSTAYDVHLVVENLSDDLGGRARVLSYLSDPQFTAFTGHLICLVEDDWLASLDLPSRSRQSDFLGTAILGSAYARYLFDYYNGDVSAGISLPLRILFIPYQSFLMGRVNGISELTATDSGIKIQEMEV